MKTRLFLDILQTVSAIAENPTGIYQMIISAVGSLGFPIVACIVLFKQNEKLEARHEEESKLFAQAINNNTLAIQRLTDKLEGEE